MQSNSSSSGGRRGHLRQSLVGAAMAAALVVGSLASAGADPDKESKSRKPSTSTTTTTTSTSTTTTTTTTTTAPSAEPQPGETTVLVAPYHSASGCEHCGGTETHDASTGKLEARASIGSFSGRDWTSASNSVTASHELGQDADKVELVARVRVHSVAFRNTTSSGRSTARLTLQVKHLSCNACSSYSHPVYYEKLIGEGEKAFVDLDVDVPVTMTNRLGSTVPPGSIHITLESFVYAETGVNWFNCTVIGWDGWIGCSYVDPQRMEIGGSKARSEHATTLTEVAVTPWS